MPRKPEFSPTRFGTYAECPVKYRYVYIERIGRFYFRAKPQLTFGAVLHRVLREFHDAGTAMSLPDLLDRYAALWVSAGFASPANEEEHRAAGTALLEGYHEMAQARTRSGVETLHTEVTLKHDLGSFVLTGRVDRIDRHPDGTLEVVDYKSGRFATSESEVAGDLAMQIYQALVRRRFDCRRVVATIYCLRTGERATAGLTDADGFENELVVRGDEILARDFDAAEPLRIAACDRCDFISRCERHWKRVAGTEREPWHGED